MYLQCALLLAAMFVCCGCSVNESQGGFRFMHARLKEFAECGAFVCLRMHSPPRALQWTGDTRMILTSALRYPCAVRVGDERGCMWGACIGVCCLSAHVPL